MSFSVFLNSVNGSGSTSSSVYQFNWDNIKQDQDGYMGKYKLYFSFWSVGTGLTTSASSVPIVRINLGTTQNSYSASTSNGTANNKLLGYLHPDQIGVNHNVLANYYDNCPVVINGLPSNNQITVEILNASGTAYTDIDAVEYLMTLYFERYDE